MRHAYLAGAAALALAFVAAPASADEGMWTFDNFPSAAVKAKYGFGPDQAWLDHVRLSAVRLSSGCSASTVSPDGLVLTNWHCVSDCIGNLSSAQQDYAAKGFLAAKIEDEKTCPAMSGEVLLAIADVTPTIQAAMKGMSGEALVKARDAAIAKLEDEGCKADPKTRCEVVSLYRGGQYKLYTYREYKDMRLVFAPETDVGFFGGDPDNFNFPRFALDGAFLRMYEDGKPVATPHHLTWTSEAPKEDDLVFVAGNPGSTSRQQTNAQLAFLRDWQLPTRQLVRSELRGRLLNYAETSEEARRSSADQIFGVENSFKAQYGQMRALLDPEFFGMKAAEEKSLRERVRADAALASEIGDPWADIEKAVAAQTELYLANDFLEARSGSISSLYGMAKIIVRGAIERAKPSAERLPGFNDAALPSLERQLAAPIPIYPDQERMGLELWLSKAREYLTVDDARIQRLLGKESPEGLAEAAIKGTKLADPAERLRLWNADLATVRASTDPLIQLALRGDPDARAIRSQWEARVSGPIAQAAERIATARFKLDGASVYPDATFTLRLSYGQVKGWTFQGRTVPAFTTIGGKYERATGAFPFQMVDSWKSAEAKVNKATPFNFSTTNDIIGGNSGSPVIDVQGRVVGAAFDGNIHSLGGDFGYDGRINRTVVVSTAAITEALRTIYPGERLLAELARSGTKPAPARRSGRRR
jgi:hypothetical protein